MLHPPLHDRPAKVKLLVLLLIVLASVFIFSLLAFLLVQPLFGVSFADTARILSDPESQQDINIMKFIQLMNALSLFIVPPLVLALLISRKPFAYYKLNTSGRMFIYLLIPAIMISAVPLINYTAELNKTLHLPEWLGWLEQKMKQMEENAERITKMFLQAEDLSSLFYNLFLIAVIPAIGEELLFRGAVQKLFSQATQNHHWGIWIGAILFSALHMQFYGFLPRMLMGAMFGYLMVWSGSLWAPIFAHFINNGVAVTASYLIGKGSISPDIEHLGEGEGQGIQVVFSLVFVSLLLYYFYRITVISARTIRE
jgi:uncharacterized protein